MEKIEDVHAIFMESVATKMTEHEQRIQAQENKLSSIEEEVKGKPDLYQDLKEVRENISLLLMAPKTPPHLAENLYSLGQRLDKAINLFQQMLETRIRHHHHIPRIIWITAGLFLVLCVVCSGWYITASRQEQYKANDTKYRKLMLVTDSALQSLLWRVDSMYAADPGQMRKNVIEQERLKQERLELIDRIQSVNSQMEQSEKSDSVKVKGNH